MIQLPEIKLVGISVRTNNTAEMNPGAAKISSTISKFVQGNIGEKIINRKNPGKTFFIYTKYESDFRGNYTYFVGEEVVSFEGASADLETHTIPPQNYVKFTNGPHKMPDVCINAWQQIWTMSPADFGGERAYIADFEIYQKQPSDQENVTLDIYIGLNKD